MGGEGVRSERAGRGMEMPIKNGQHCRANLSHIERNWQRHITLSHHATRVSETLLQCRPRK